MVFISFTISLDIQKTERNGKGWEEQETKFYHSSQPDPMSSHLEQFSFLFVLKSFLFHFPWQFLMTAFWQNRLLSKLVMRAPRSLQDRTISILQEIEINYDAHIKGLLKRGQKSCRAKRYIHYIGTCMKKGYIDITRVY